MKTWHYVAIAAAVYIVATRPEKVKALAEGPDEPWYQFW